MAFKSWRGSPRSSRTLEDKGDGLSLGAIAQANGLPRSTVKRLVDALAREELLEVHGQGGIRLGPVFMRLARHSQLDISTHARPFLEALNRQTEETVVLSCISGNELLLLHSVLSPQALRVAPVAGNFLSLLDTSSGKSLLSHYTDEQVVALITPILDPQTDQTATIEQLLSELAQIRESGVAYDAGEHTPGIGAVSVSLETIQGNYSIALLGPDWRLTERLEEFVPLLKETRDTMLKTFRSPN